MDDVNQLVELLVQVLDWEPTLRAGGTEALELALEALGIEDVQLAAMSSDDLEEVLDAVGSIEGAEVDEDLFERFSSPRWAEAA